MSRPLASVGAVARSCRPQRHCLLPASTSSSTTLISENAVVRGSSSYLSVPIHYQQCSRFHKSRAQELHNSDRRRNDASKTSDPETANRSGTSEVPGIEQLLKGKPRYTKGRMERIMRETENDFDGTLAQLPEEDPIEVEDFGRPDAGFFAEGEENARPGDDEDFQGDDITSTAHAELEYVREMRELFRASAWDMPLLWSHAKPFIPPTEASPLRFRYTTYFGEYHPAARKVVVTFTPSELDQDLTQVQINKMIKLLGPRYNPSTNTAKISCEMYPTVPQNKRWLGDMVEKILAEVKDPTKDTFEDMPFDFRHHVVKTKPTFPEEWKLTEEKRASLAAERSRTMLLESEMKVTDNVIDGKLIADRTMDFEDTRGEPVTVPAGRPGGARR